VVALACSRSKQSPPVAAPPPAPAPEQPPSEPVRPLPSPEHAVIAHLLLSNKKFGSPADVADCQALQLALEKDILSAHAGEMDGNEIGQGECTLFMYGPNADKLFDAVAPRLRASRLAKGGWVEKRYGAALDPQAREVRVGL
jgi:hypothetical protein